MQTISLNDSIYVELTEKGVQVLRQSLTQLALNNPQVPTLQKTGLLLERYRHRGTVFKFTLWEAFSIFGPYIKNTALDFNSVFASANVGYDRSL